MSNPLFLFLSFVWNSSLIPMTDVYEQLGSHPISYWDKSTSETLLTDLKSTVMNIQPRPTILKGLSSAMEGQSITMGKANELALALEETLNSKFDEYLRVVNLRLTEQIRTPLPFSIFFLLLMCPILSSTRSVGFSSAEI